MNATYQIGSREGKAILEFPANVPGAYALTVGSGDPQVPVMLMVKQQDFAGFFVPLMTGVCGGMIFGLTGVAVLVFGILRARRQPAAGAA